MHLFLVTLLSLFVSLCHHSAPQTQAQLQIQGASWGTRTHMFSFPNRHELAQERPGSIYAEPACLSCGQMNVSFIAR